MSPVVMNLTAYSLACSYSSVLVQVDALTTDRESWSLPSAAATLSSIVTAGANAGGCKAGHGYVPTWHQASLKNSSQQVP